MAPPLGAAGIATIVAGALTFDWSLGFKGLTYDDLYKRSVIHRGMRVPARFSVVVGAALALLAAFGARRLLRLGRTPWAARVICAALTLLVLFDLRLDPRLQSYWATIPSIYDRSRPTWSSSSCRATTTSITCTSRPDTGRTCSAATAATCRSTRVSRPGCKGFRRPRDWINCAGAGATHLTYNCALEERQDRCAAVFEALDGNPALELVASERWERESGRPALSDSSERTSGSEE